MRNLKRKNTFLSFQVGKETFAVSVIKVLEVLEKQYLTEIPNASAHMKGVINFRGKIIPVIDTRLKFGLEERSPDEKYVIIVFDVHLDEKKFLIGAKADSVQDVISIEDENIMDVPELGYNYNTEYLLGMIKNEGSFTMIINIDKVFSKEEVELLSKASENTNELAIAD